MEAVCRTHRSRCLHRDGVTNVPVGRTGPDQWYGTMTRSHRVVPLGSRPLPGRTSRCRAVAWHETVTPDLYGGVTAAGPDQGFERAAAAEPTWCRVPDFLG